MILTKEEIESVRQRLLTVIEKGAAHFAEVSAATVVDPYEWNKTEKIKLESDGDMAAAEELRSTIKALSVDIAGAARNSPLLADADFQELRHCTRQMLAAVRLGEYQHTGVYVHHDEGTVLGVDPPSHDVVQVADVSTARGLYDDAGARLLDVVDLLCPTGASETNQDGSTNYRPNTAFIMMAIDETNPELEDVRDGIKEVFGEFGIRAVVGDEIEHEGAVTDRILQEIDTSEFLFADLTHERPNVYYEISYAHARNRRVVLFRKQGTKLHFDVAHRNCPEYRNTTELKTRLRKRLESITNRPARPVGRR